MKKDDLLIDHEPETNEDKVGIILEVETDHNNKLLYVDVLYPTGIYEVEIPIGDSSRFEVINESR